MACAVAALASMIFCMLKAFWTSAALFLLLALAGCGSGDQRPEVIAYVSVDQVYAEPILRDFTEQTGIEVRALYDVEASKTTGLVNRLVAERDRPRADVYWNGEFVQTMLLKDKGVLATFAPAAYSELPETFRDPDKTWTGVGGRLRVLLAGEKTGNVSGLHDFLEGDLPPSQLGIAYPLFGSSVTHAAALYASWGAGNARAFYRALRDRGVRVVDGNAAVRDLVVSGELQLGLTDSDDACGAISRGANVRLVIPDQASGGTLLIPGTVAVIAGAPHRSEAHALTEYLSSAATESKLMAAGFCQVSLRPGGGVAPCLGGAGIQTLQAPPDAVWQNLESSRKDMSDIFLR
jgi:iron(III) transport system substrate-binding protein